MHAQSQLLQKSAATTSNEHRAHQSELNYTTSILVMNTEHINLTLVLSLVHNEYHLVTLTLLWLIRSTKLICKSAQESVTFSQLVHKQDPLLLIMINMWQHNKYVAEVLNQSINVISGTHHLLLPKLANFSRKSSKSLLTSD